MFEVRPQESGLNADDRSLSQLSEQIGCLRELIVVMVDQGRDTRRQSELLFEMLRALRAAKLARARSGTGPAHEAIAPATASRPRAHS
jgi:hypothetical protein